MGRKPGTDEELDFSEYLRQGRDEMNLLEHSFSGASKVADRKTGSVRFESEAIDPETREPVIRSWELTFNGKYGRPTPKDDDVYLALMKVTQASGLMLKSADGVDPRVHFTGYELIRILGWPNNGPSYKAIDDALNRIGGVWIVAKNYWYDNVNKLWADRKFGIIDDAFLYERAKYDRAKKRAKAEGEATPKSWIRWSDVMAESFQSGYVRKLDIETYRSLKNPISRKLYRYLGMHFYRQSKLKIDVRQLCHEKLGYPMYDNNKCCSKLEAPLTELADRKLFGIRFEFKKSYGKCELIVSGSNAQPKPAKQENASSLVGRLVEFGISRKDAVGFEGRHSAARIMEDVEAVLFSEKKGLVKQNRAGLLFKMLDSDEPWARPEGFMSSAERARSKNRRMEQKQLAEQAELEREAVEKRKQREREERFEEFFETLHGEELREEYGREALRKFSFNGKKYHECLRNGNESGAEEYRRMAMMLLWEATLESDCLKRSA